MVENDGRGKVAYDFARFPREFVSYKWYKPLLVALVATVLTFAFSLALIVGVGIAVGDFDYISDIGEGYDDMDAYTGPGAAISLGTLAVLIPALALAALIVRDRPFSSYSTSRGGWKWGAFFKCALVAVAVLAAEYLVEAVVFHAVPEGDGVVRFTAVGLALCIVLVPLQCLAEEYVFRGFILQAVGSWTKLPAVGIAVAAVAFAAGHPYNGIGVVLIFVNGVVWGFVAWRSRGLEASSAIHIVNNYVAFLSSGFGIEAQTSQVSVEALVVEAVATVVYAAAVLTLGERFGWFAPTGDGAARFNEGKREKQARKRAVDEGAGGPR